MDQQRLLTPDNSSTGCYEGGWSIPRPVGPSESPSYKDPEDQARRKLTLEGSMERDHERAGASGVPNKLKLQKSRNLWSAELGRQRREVQSPEGGHGCGPDHFSPSPLPQLLSLGGCTRREQLAVNHKLGEEDLFLGRPGNLGLGLRRISWPGV